MPVRAASVAPAVSALVKVLTSAGNHPAWLSAKSPRYDQWPTHSQQPLAPPYPCWILGGRLPSRAETDRAFDHVDRNANDPDRVV
jgi:hypothetical protein